MRDRDPLRHLEGWTFVAALLIVTGAALLAKAGAL